MDKQTATRPRGKVLSIQEMIKMDCQFEGVKLPYKNLRLIFNGNCPNLQAYILKYFNFEVIRVLLENGNFKLLVNILKRDFKNLFSTVENVIEYKFNQYLKEDASGKIDVKKVKTFDKIITTFFKVLKTMGCGCSETTLKIIFNTWGFEKFIKNLPPTCLINDSIFEMVTSDYYENYNGSHSKGSLFNKFTNMTLLLKKNIFSLFNPNNFTVENIQTISDLNYIFKIESGHSLRKGRGPKTFKIPKGVSLEGLNLKAIALNYSIEMVEVFIKIYPNSLKNKEFLTFCLLSFYSFPQKFGERRLKKIKGLMPYANNNDIIQLPLFLEKNDHNIEEFCTLLKSWGDNQLILKGIFNLLIQDGLSDEIQKIIENIFNFQFAYDNIYGQCNSCLNELTSKVSIKPCINCDYFIHINCVSKIMFDNCEECYKPLFSKNG